jgi:hypothetical protein
MKVTRTSRIENLARIWRVMVERLPGWRASIVQNFPRSWGGVVELFRRARRHVSEYLGLSGEGGADSPMALTRRKLATLVGGVIVLSVVATLLASMLIRSPAEVAARTAAPAATTILVPAEMRKIETKVVTRATGKYGSPRDLILVKSPLKVGPRAVTSLPEVGAKLDEGSVVMTVSGRPVFLFRGAQPSYRDLGPGVRGPDVLQLEQALVRLGLNPGPVDDLYDMRTGRAVLELYRRAGIRPYIASVAELRVAEPIEANLLVDGFSTGGPQMPSDEMIFMPNVPLRVSEVKTHIGAEPVDSLLVTTDSTVTADGALTVDEARLVKPGMEIRIDEPTLGISARGTVKEVAERPGTKGVDGFHVFVSAAVDNPPPTLVGSSVRMSIPVSSTQGEVLAAPVSAVYLQPDGTSSVRRSVNGQVQVLPVTPGVSSEGYVAVTAPGSDLKAGDLLVAGTESR